MAYYDALIAKWATLNPAFTTQQKLDAINALTVSMPQKAILQASNILNACQSADLLALTVTQISLMQLLLAGQTVDASAGTSIRAVFQSIFAGKTTTLSALGALVAPFDNATIPWWQATVAQGGGGLASPVSVNDLISAGGLT